MRTFLLAFTIIAALGTPFAHAMTMEEYLHTPKRGEIHQAADTAIVHSCERRLSSGANVC